VWMGASCREEVDFRVFEVLLKTEIVGGVVDCLSLVAGGRGGFDLAVGDKFGRRRYGDYVMWYWDGID